ncbi:MAG: tyrosine-type recombinase/integrase [Bacteroidota bacterium]
MAYNHPQKAVRISHKRLKGYFDEFVRSLDAKRPETKGTYERALREFLRWFDKDRGCLFRVRDIERYKKYLTRRKKLSAVSVSTYLTALRQFCRYLEWAGALKVNPAKDVKGNARPMHHSREIIRYQDIERLLASVDVNTEQGARDYAILKAMLGCGLSEIEIVRADVGDMGDDEGKPILAVQGKGRSTKDERVYLPQDVALALKAYLGMRHDINPDRPLFVSAGNRTRGLRMTTRGIRERVNYYLQVSGVKQGKARRITAFSLRHTAALILVEQGASAEELMKKLRLGSVMTAEVYLKQKGTLQN